MNPNELMRLCERTEAEGWMSIYGHAPAAFAAEYGLTAQRFADVVALTGSNIPYMMFNRVIGAGVYEPLTERLLDEISAYYAETGVKRFAIQVCPGAQPASLTDLLAARGFIHKGDWVKVYRDHRPAYPMETDLRIVPTAPEQAEAYAAVSCRGFGLSDEMIPLVVGMVTDPNWRTYLALDGDEPVAIGALHIQGEVGWLGGGATLPSHRGRGAQSALMARRIHDGIAAGCRWFVSETGAERPEYPNPSFHNMLRNGCRVAYIRADWRSPEL